MERIRVNTYRNSNEIDAPFSEFVIVIATVETGFSSKNFLQQFETIKDQLSKRNDTLIYHIQVAGSRLISSSHLSSLALPGDIARFIQWYPSIAVFKAKSWVEAMTGEKLEGTVMNGVMKDGKVLPSVNINFEIEYILKWITSEIKLGKIDLNVPILIKVVEEKLQKLIKDETEIKQEIRKLNRWLTTLTTLQCSEFNTFCSETEVLF